MSDKVYPPWEPPFAGSESEHLLGSLPANGGSHGG